MRIKKYFILFLLILVINETQINKIYSKESEFQKINSNDYIILGTAALLNASSILLEDYSEIDINTIYKLNKNDINPFDRSFMFDYNKDYKLASDISVSTTLALPVIFSLFNKNSTEDIINFNSKYFQAIGLSSGLFLMSKSLFTRYRPYMYGNELSINEKRNYDNRNSFFSGHTALAFSSAVFLAYNIENSDFSRSTKNLVWAGSLALASTTGYLRILAGKHFLTDVIVGAAVGSALAILISEVNYENIFINNTSNNFENIQINYLTFKFKI